MENDAASMSSGKRDAGEMAQEVEIRLPTPFTAFDVDACAIKVRKTKTGVFHSALCDNKAIYIDLTPTDDAWLNAPFGFDTGGKYVKADMAIVGGAGTDYEALKMRMLLTPELHDFFSKVEAKFKDELAALYPSLEWKSGLDEFVALDGYLFEATAVIKVKGQHTTDFMINTEKGVVEGTGLDFLKPLLEGNYSFSGCSVRCQIKLNQAWTTKEKMGLNWTIVNMMVQPGTRRTEFGKPAGYSASLFKRR